MSYVPYNILDISAGCLSLILLPLRISPPLLLLRPLTVCLHLYVTGFIFVGLPKVISEKSNTPAIFLPYPHIVKPGADGHGFDPHIWQHSFVEFGY